MEKVDFIGEGRRLWRRVTKAEKLKFSGECCGNCERLSLQEKVELNGDG